MLFRDFRFIIWLVRSQCYSQTPYVENTSHMAKKKKKTVQVSFLLTGETSSPWATWNSWAQRALLPHLPKQLTHLVSTIVASREGLLQVAALFSCVCLFHASRRALTSSEHLQWQSSPEVHSLIASSTHGWTWVTAEPSACIPLDCSPILGSHDSVLPSSNTVQTTRQLIF